jgi:uncharacterized protein YcnI
MEHSRSRRRPRAAIVALAVLVVALAGAGPAAAHVEASAEGAQAGTGPVVVDFLAEAESTTAGIVGVKVQLPAGISPDGVALASGPAGWTLTPTADGYEAGGPGIGPGVDLQYGITIAQLPPDATELPFKTLLRYSDGREDAWIELPSESNPAPEQPAPTITVAPAPPAATTAPSSAAPTPSADAPSSGPAEPAEAAQTSADDGASTWWIVVVAIATLAALAGGLWFWRSRTSRAS